MPALIKAGSVHAVPLAARGAYAAQMIPNGLRIGLGGPNSGVVAIVAVVIEHAERIAAHVDPVRRRIPKGRRVGIIARSDARQRTRADHGIAARSQFDKRLARQGVSGIGAQGKVAAIEGSQPLSRPRVALAA